MTPDQKAELREAISNYTDADLDQLRAELEDKGDISTLMIVCVEQMGRERAERAAKRRPFRSDVIPF
jgi:septum formation topological specificity factor MinE